MRNVVTIDRDGTTSVKGYISDVDDDVVTVSSQDPCCFGDENKNTFVELKDVRGVTVTDAT
jgi:hypothetical protein